ncbi:MAG: hypothetical protein BGO55_29910 [Sphingobacteriales bacterium 50-39]|nr:SusC/RagA family TonB-linked outer membrane protein [Sphingobacteriales bacterium]OJW60747.1 MAG: hypothetical protein BGO55_29910 [Sphingobacteriales bacterium 50-39]
MKSFLSVRCIRLTYLIIFLITCTASFAQNVTLHFADAPIPTVLRDIERQGGFTIAFRTEVFEHAPNISLDLKHVSVEKALSTCLGGLEFSYKKGDNSFSVFSTASNGTSVFSPLKGTVINAEGAPLPNVSVIIPLTGKGAITDINGRFCIFVTAYKSEVVVSCTGYLPITERLDNREKRTTTLQMYSISMDEHIVRAYGTTTPRLNTGSSFEVKGSVFQQQPVGNVLAALEGRVPGLTIQQISGYPGSSYNFLLRGQSSIDNGKQPLIIVDGVILSGGILSPIASGAVLGPSGPGTLNGINPDNIANIEILKDAAATAIYGSRGANGAILITLKKGVPGKPQLSFHTYAGITKSIGRGQLMNTEQYLSMRRDAILNDGLTPNQYTIPESAWDTTVSHNYRNTIMGGTGFVNDHSIDFSGGNTTHNWFVDGNYHRESAVVPGRQFDGRAIVYGKYAYESPNKKLRLQISGNYSREDNRLPAIDLSTYIQMAPNTPASTFKDGVYSWWDNNAPFLDFTAVQLNQYKAGIGNWLAHAGAGYEPLKGLKLNGIIGCSWGAVEEESWLPAAAQDPLLMPTGTYYWVKNKYTSAIVDITANYSKLFGRSKIDMLVGATRQQEIKSAMSLTIGNYDELQPPSSGDPWQTQAAFNRVVYRYEALLARIEYNLLDRYILTASGRRDASSRFGPGRQHGTFGAIGAAWNFIGESFVTWPHWLSFGKLRISYGTTGNDQIGDYRFAALYTPTSAALGYQGSQGLVPASFYNPNLSWEVNHKAELGFDLGLWQNRFTLSAAAYRAWTDNEVITESLASQAGLPGQPANQRVVILNKGLECSIRSINVSSPNFHWSSSLVLTIPENKLLSFQGLKNSTYDQTYREGKSLSEQIVYGYKGVDPQTGLYTFLHKDSNAVLDKNDVIPGGNLDMRCYGGLDNILSYKKWELAFFWEFRQQNGINPLIEMLRQNLPGMPGNYSQGNFPVQFLQYWRHPGEKALFQKVTAIPDPEAAERAADLVISNARIRDASFIRLKSLSIGYKLDSHFIKKCHLKEGIAFLQGQNILTITSFPFSDPETQSFSILPPVRTFVIGFKINV